MLALQCQLANADGMDVAVRDSVDASCFSLPDKSDWERKITLKTNVPAWALLWINIAPEIDFDPHWSGTLPIYYSGFNYFTGHRKYRTFALMPEVRWWPKYNNEGFFMGLHTGLVWYNVAFEGQYRYQDHDRNSPAIGAGLTFGWRFNFTRNPRWKMEAAIGAGVYRLCYDRFLNYHNGLFVDTKRRTFFGIDNAALSICYQFGAKKSKGGDR